MIARWAPQMLTPTQKKAKSSALETNVSRHVKTATSEGRVACSLRRVGDNKPCLFLSQEISSVKSSHNASYALFIGRSSLGGTGEHVMGASRPAGRMPP
ncbi:hypothetical protein ANN_25981 [Periplaneta americana]|uniref:Uncharacterized protein n=1 Tax=Periplaneta americana TaxID=6978 RepID=A0ABQ8S5F2_PERAM|nr:hypothetical protein ANN_25981 [Periplaneta americana]